jgi:hypothetical protein
MWLLYLILWIRQQNSDEIWRFYQQAVKGMEATGGKTVRRIHWHGTRKREIIAANARPVTK